MSWTNFLIVIFIVYLLYYSLNLLFDLFLSPRISSSGEEEEEIFLSETFSPELITPGEKNVAESTAEPKSKVRPRDLSGGVISSGGLVSSGGVGLKQLFSLAKNNLIEHTRAIPY